MKSYITTPRLTLREIVPGDEEAMYEMDSDPEVHRYLGGKPVQSRQQIRDVIAFIRRQYEENGIGRWAAVEKETGTFIGWTGLKVVKDNINGYQDYYDLGYRLLKRYWGKGYATETAIATVQYGFEQMGLETIYGMADSANAASIHVLQKAGLKITGLPFLYEGAAHNWFRIQYQEWLNTQQT